MQNIAAESYSIRITFVSVKVPTYFLPFHIYPRTSQHKTCAHYQKFNQPPSFQVKCTILPANGVVLWGWNRIQGNCANTFREKKYCNAAYIVNSYSRWHVTFALLLINAGKCLIHLITFCYVCAFFYPIINGLKGPIEEMYVHK